MMLSAVARFWIITDAGIRNSTIEGGVSLNYLGYKDTSCFLDSKTLTLSHLMFLRLGSVL